MPRFPVHKYCERINFFFVIFEKRIPVESGFLFRMRCLFNSRRTGKTDPNSRICNVDNLPCTRSKYVRAIREALENFVMAVEDIVMGICKTNSTRSLRALESDTIWIINSALQKMDNTWLKNFGRVRADAFRLTTKEFMEILFLKDAIVVSDHMHLRREMQLMYEAINFEVEFLKTLKIQDPNWYEATVWTKTIVDGPNEA